MCRDRGGARAQARAASRTGARRNSLRGFRLLWGPCEPQVGRACRRPASAHRDKGAEPPSLPGSYATAITANDMNDRVDQAPAKGWWQRLTGGLKRTSSAINTAIADVVTKRKLDRAMIEEIEDLLIRADLGVDVAARIADSIGAGR